MMKLLRNKEIARTFWLYIIFSGIVTAFVFIWDREFGVFMIGVCAVFVIMYLVTTGMRYKRIADLSGDIDRILHGDNHISLKKYSEGELAILQSEIYKMTVRLREQQQRLQDDKIYLADSIADISHQIRTPLTSINLVVSMLAQDDLPDERRQKLFRELRELLARIDSLITVLLKISKLDAGTVQFFSENVTFDELIRMATEPILIPMELRGQELIVKTDGDFHGDVQWTSEAIGNIVKNCMEHTPDGGCITITAAENPLYTEIVITDNGAGIDKEDLPHIFERFYKGKNSGDKSFGIGLALARMIITRQNGTIKAENIRDTVTEAQKDIAQKGAKFTIRFYKGTV